MSGLLLLLALALPGGPDPVSTYAAEPLDRGEALLGELACTRCHAVTDRVEARLATKRPPRLEEVASRVTPQWLARWLADPHATKPGTTMPNALARLRGAELELAVDQLTHFLASLGEPLDTAPVTAYAEQVEEGRQLYHEVGCVACHGPLEPLDALWWAHWELTGAETFEDPWADELAADAEPVPPPRTVPLGDLARKTTVDALARFLRDPLAVRPSGRMPDLGLTEREARDIALYLLRDQARAAGTTEPGLAYRYYEDVFDGAVAPLDELEPVRRGSTPDFATIPEHREDHFAFRFDGWVEVPEAGEYTFAITSDDGSRLWIGGELVAPNDGQHAMVERTGTVTLEPGRHPIRVDWFEHLGQDGLEVRWSGPGLAPGPIPAAALTHEARTYAPLDAAPLAVDPEKAAGGAALFAYVGCVDCHELEERRLPPGVHREAPALFALDSRTTDGCWSAAPREGLPRYDLEPADRTALSDVLRRRGTLRETPAPATLVRQTLERFRCTGCHERQGYGGPHPDHRDFFFAVGDVDLGEEGRIPPALEHTGWKLRPAWLAEVLREGAGVRPYLATRMPRFGFENVGHLVEAFDAADGRPGDDVEPAFSLERVEQGRRLVGTLGGLGCVQCHTFAGYPSLGIPAVDMASMHARIQPGWFAALLRDPQAIGMNTRMTELFTDGVSPVHDVYGGDVERQIAAIRCYLSLGASMPLPSGLVVPEGAYELRVGDEPVLVGVFMADVSPRTLLVGNPEHTHYAFDVERSRLAKAWRGHFFDAEGTWHGRAGRLEVPQGEDVIELAPGPPFALLSSDELAWPAPRRVPRPRVLGRRFDAERRPVFRYAVGPYTVEERPVPVLREGGSWLVRRFRVSRPAGAEAAPPLGMRVAAGRLVEPVRRRDWLVDGRVLHRLPDWASPELVEEADGTTSLVIPLRFDRADPDGERELLAFDVEMTW